MLLFATSALYLYLFTYGLSTAKLLFNSNTENLLSEEPELVGVSDI